MAPETLLQFEWSLILVLSTLLMNVTASIMSSFAECKDLHETTSFGEKELQCTCEEYGHYEITCEDDIKTVKVYFKRHEYVAVECFSTNEELLKLPHMNLGEVKDLQFENCKLPHNTSLKTVLNRLGINKVRSLYFKYDNRNISNNLFSGHLKGFEDVSKLSIEVTNLKSLPENVFDEISNITSLKLGNMEIETIKKDLSNLVKLKTLEIFKTTIARLEDGAFETLTNLQTLSMWSNKLETITKENFRGLKSLQVLGLSSNRITSIEPDSFAYLENVEQIDLKTNRFTSLPEGLFSSNKHLREVTMVFNNIPILSSRLFANIPDLTFVDMSNSGIVSMPEDLFLNSINLVNVKLSGNKILELPEAIFRGLVRLERLELQSNTLMSLGNNLLKDCRKLKHINLSFNDIESIPSDIFRFTTDLTELYISNNRLTRIDSKTFDYTNLQFVDMSNNRLEFNNNSPFHNQYNMESLVLRNNSLKNIKWDFPFIMMNLRTLDLSYNNISYIDYSFIQFSNGIEVDLSNNHISEINFKAFEDISEPPRKSTSINFNNNPLDCNCGAHYFVKFLQNLYSFESSKFINVKANGLKCNQPEELKDELVKSVDVMDLTCVFRGNDEEKCPEKCKCSVRLADRALIVDCSSQGLEELPKIPVASKINFLYTILNIEDNYLKELPSVHNFIGYSEVRQIFARGNNISSIRDYQLPSNLTHLDISDNNLQTLDNSAIKKLNSTSSLQKISLSDNRLSCDCKMESLFLFLQESHKKISNYRTLNCLNGKSISKMTFEDLCPKNMQFIITISVVLALFGVLVGVLIAIYFKYQQEIKIWMYWNNILPFIFNSDVLDTDKKYDAFISYSHKDEDFVVDHLIPELEQRRKFNLCIHKRNWLAGDSIPEQIIRSVSDSRRTIVVLSSHYVESVWGAMEFREAHKSSMKEQVSRVIVIIYGQVDKSALHPELKSYIDMNTYIEWGDPWFWERLHFALRTIKTKKTGNVALKPQKHLKIIGENKLGLFQSSAETSLLATHPIDCLPEDLLNGKYFDGSKFLDFDIIVNDNSNQSDMYLKQ